MFLSIIVYNNNNNNNTEEEEEEGVDGSDYYDVDVNVDALVEVIKKRWYAKKTVILSWLITVPLYGYTVMTYNGESYKFLLYQ